MLRFHLIYVSLIILGRAEYVLHFEKGETGKS